MQWRNEVFGPRMWFIVALATAGVWLSGLPWDSALARVPGYAFADGRYAPDAPSGRPVIVPFRLAQNGKTEPSGRTLRVESGRSIQGAILRAKEGDRIEVEPGEYNESLYIKRPNLTIVGLNEDGERPILDGLLEWENAIECEAEGLSIEGFVIRNYTGSAVVAESRNTIRIADLIVQNVGPRAIQLSKCQDIRIERCVIGGSSHAGIFITQSLNIIVRDNEVYNNVAGIELENSMSVVIENNSAHHNTTGLLVICIPNLSRKDASYTKVIHNRLWANNHENFSQPGTAANAIVSGIGMLIMAADHTEVTQNVVSDNGSYGLVVMSLNSSPLVTDPTQELDIEPNSDHSYIHHNIYTGNGAAPSVMFKRLFPDVPAGDLFWDSTGERNQFQERGEPKTFPEKLIQEEGGVHTKVMHFI